MINVQIVVCKDLALVDVSTLVDFGAIQVKSELFTIPALNLLHLRVISKGEMVDGVREIEGSSIHIEPLYGLSERVGREMEISWDLVDDNGALNQAALLIVHCFYSLFVNYIWIVSCVLEMCSFIHLHIIMN